MTGSSAQFAKMLLTWYDAHRRDLPWRVSRDAGKHVLPDPYHVMVSEAMLQQTQVATVVPYFLRFIGRFPTIIALAESDEQDVLRLWQGLGYYSRARNLRKAAQKVVQDFGGQLPSDVKMLLTLPGVGRYTAGAIASIAFGSRAPIVDGNVARVLCRIDKITTDPRDRDTADLLWTRAERILPHERLGDFNSAMMELGATVCTPRSPRCLMCPVNDMCDAYAAGVQETIPPAKKAVATPLETRWIFILRAGNYYLVEQRPATGRWAGMWQFVTVAADAKRSAQVAAREATDLTIGKLHKFGEVSHALTHRRYTFTVYATDVDQKNVPNRTWATLTEIDKLPLSKPQLKALQLAQTAWPAQTKSKRRTIVNR